MSACPIYRGRRPLQTASGSALHCTGKLVVGPRYRFRFLRQRAEVIFWTVGSTEPGLRTIVSALVRRRMALLERWRQHNVEEAGNLPCFLPELYAAEAGS